jgi:hypothetical protein
VVAVHDLHEAGIDALGKAFMVLDQRASTAPGRLRCPPPLAPRADCPSTPPRSSRLAGHVSGQSVSSASCDCRLRLSKGTSAGVRIQGAHIHGDLAVVFQARLDHAGHGFHADRACR